MGERSLWPSGATNARQGRTPGVESRRGALKSSQHDEPPHHSIEGLGAGFVPEYPQTVRFLNLLYDRFRLFQPGE